MRIATFIILIFAALYLPFWIFMAAACAYALMVESPYELLILAVCIDATYSDPARIVWYAYTLGVGILMVGTAMLRPYFSFYKTHDF